MTPRERFECALNFQEADRVPWTPFFGAAARRVYGAPYAHYAQWGDVAAKCQIQSQQLFAFDILCAATDPLTESAGFGQRIDFPEESAPCPAPGSQLLSAVSDYAKLTAYNPLQNGTRTQEILECCDILMNERGSELPVIVKINSPLSVLASLRTASALCQDCHDTPDAVDQALTTVTDCLLPWVQRLAALETLILFDVPFASDRLLPRDTWFALEGRHLSLWSQTVRQAGGRTAVQAVNAGPYFDLLIQAAGPVLIAAVHLPAVHEEGVKPYRAALWGGLSADLLAAAAPDAIEAECRHLISRYAGGGGYILAPGREFPDDANLRSVQVIRDAAVRCGTYPL